MEQAGKQSEKLTQKQGLNPLVDLMPLGYAPTVQRSKRWVFWIAAVVLISSITPKAVSLFPELWSRAQLAYWKFQCVHYSNAAGYKPPASIPNPWLHFHALLGQPYPVITPSNALLFSGLIQNEHAEEYFVVLQATRTAVGPQAECFDFVMNPSLTSSREGQLYNCGSSGLGTETADVVDYSYALRDPINNSHLTFVCYSRANGAMVFNVWMKGDMLWIDRRDQPTSKKSR